MSWRYEPLWGSLVSELTPRIYHITGSKVFPDRLPVRMGFSYRDKGPCVNIDGTQGQGHMVLSLYRAEISESKPNRIRLEGERYGLLSCIELRFPDEKLSRETYSMVRRVFGVNGGTFH